MTRRFRIPLDNQRPIFGVFLAAHAIPDAIDIMHTGVGCKPKAQRQISSHDRAREAQNKMVWSDVDESLLIRGSMDRLVDMTVETVKRRGNVGLVFLTTSTAMEMTGRDLGAAAARIRERAGIPVVPLPTPGYGHDLHQGYQRAVLSVLEMCDWARRPDPRPSLAVVGHLFGRYEADGPADLAEVARLLGRLGLPVAATLLSGTPVAGLLEAARASSMVVLPWAASIADRAAAVSGRPCIRTDLPMGIAGTARFLREVAAAAGVGDRAVGDLVDSETGLMGPYLRVARERLAGARIAILADTPVAAGIAGLAAALGALPVLVGLLDRTLGGRPAREAALSRSGRALPGGCAVLENPTADDVGDAGGDPEVVVAPDVWLPPAFARGAARVEIGIPSNRRHAVFPQPTMGFRGAMCMAQRLADARSGAH
mgnify:CR=1 FL=1